LCKQCDPEFAKLHYDRNNREAGQGLTLVGTLPQEISAALLADMAGLYPAVAHTALHQLNYGKDP
jgi:hypothetical protein